MISIWAYELFSIIACGEVTAHTLYVGINIRTKNKEISDELLLNGLLELCFNKLIIFSFHENYGNSKPSLIDLSSSEQLVQLWLKIFKVNGPRSEIPNVATLTFELSHAGKLFQPDKEKILKLYEPFLTKWYD